MVYGYIYLTENQINHKWYIGQHARSTFDTKYYGSGKTLKKALDKYGKENFTCIPIDWAYSKEELNEKEIWWIAYFRSLSQYEGYNVLNGGYYCFINHVKRSEIMKNIWKNEKSRYNLIQGMKDYYIKPESRDKKSKEGKRRFENPETSEYWRKHNGEIVKAFYDAHPEHKDVIGRLSKERWSNPDYRKSHCVLSNDDIMDIICMIWNKEKQRNIAKRFNVSEQLISNIKYGKVYCLITDITFDSAKNFWKNEAYN